VKARNLFTNNWESKGVGMSGVIGVSTLTYIASRSAATRNTRTARDPVASLRPDGTGMWALIGPATTGNWEKLWSSAVRDSCLGRRGRVRIEDGVAVVEKFTASRTGTGRLRARRGGS
jgi:hypothetical protein